MKEKALSVSVLRDSLGDCTNGGVTATNDRLLLVGEGVSGPFEVKEGEVYLQLVRRNIGGEYLHAEPRINGEIPEDKKGMIGPMFGGNYIKTSDSRFPNRYPIPVHDRWETPEAYEFLSR